MAEFGNVVSHGAYPATVTGFRDDGESALANLLAALDALGIIDDQTEETDAG